MLSSGMGNKNSGRRPRNPGAPKNSMLWVRVSVAELDAYTRAAQSAGMSRSDWARGVLLQAAVMGEASVTARGVS